MKKLLLILTALISMSAHAGNEPPSTQQREGAGNGTVAGDFAQSRISEEARKNPSLSPEEILLTLWDESAGRIPDSTLSGKYNAYNMTSYAHNGQRVYTLNFKVFSAQIGYSEAVPSAPAFKNFVQKKGHIYIDPKSQYVADGMTLDTITGSKIYTSDTGLVFQDHVKAEIRQISEKEFLVGFLPWSPENKNCSFFYKHSSGYIGTYTSELEQNNSVCGVLYLWKE